MNLAVFVSGRGSNLQAILNSNELKNFVKVQAVFSDKSACGAFEIAKKYSINTFYVGNKNELIGTSCYIHFNNLSEKLSELKIDLIVLAGFLKLIPNEIIKNYKWKIINIHPALLPSFGGKGMYGINVHKAVFNSSVRISGPTVHFVDESYDTGRIIAQQCVDISDVKSPEEIAERVLKVEHKILPYVILKIAEGKVKLAGERVIIEN